MPIEFSCQNCGAEIGKPCTSLLSPNKVIKSFHNSRMLKATNSPLAKYAEGETPPAVPAKYVQHFELIPEDRLRKAERALEYLRSLSSENQLSLAIHWFNCWQDELDRQQTRH